MNAILDELGKIDPKVKDAYQQRITDFQIERNSEGQKRITI